MGTKKLRSIHNLNKKQSTTSFFNNDWADNYLSFQIGILNGKNVICSRSGRVHLALIAKELLKDHGFYWHCKILDAHIHRTAKLEHRQKGDDSQQSRREDSLNKPQKRVIKFVGDLYK